MANTPLKVIIVGAGFGGLAAAIECAERGEEVVLIEKYPDSNSQGDILDFFPNGGRVIHRWDNGNVGKRIHETGCNKIREMELWKYDGKFITNVPWARNEEERETTYAGHRGKQHSIILDYAKRVVKDLKLGIAVVDYLEKGDQAGVVLETGETLWADCVIAADGPRSLARKKVLGLTEEKDGSGWAVFRSFFQTTEEMRSHPGLANFFYSDRDTVRFWMYESLSLMAFAWNEGKDVAWVLIHPDNEGESAESWSNIAPKEKVTEWMKPFTGEDAQALLEITPPGITIDFKLVYRPPIQNWSKKGGRILLIGDAAHANLPTAAQGASQAVEDAVTIAYSLSRCNGNVPLAVEATQRIRYHRSNAVHKSGQLNRDAFQNIPWDVIEADPEEWSYKRFPKMKKWDPLEHVMQHYDQVAKDIENGVDGPLDKTAVPLPAEGVFDFK